MRVDRVASANVFKGLPVEVASEIAADVCAHADLVGLQEWPRKRDKALGHKVEGWAFGRPLIGGGPVGARADRYRLRRVRGVMLCPPGRVDKSPGRRSVLGASIASVGLFDDLELHERVVVINYHLTAEVQRGGRYRTDRPLRVARHKREVARLERLVRRQLKKGRRVYVVGDSNFDGFDLDSLTSCWNAGHRRRGTLGARAVDVILAQDAPVRVQVMTSRSDHRHPIATYRRNA